MVKRHLYGVLNYFSAARITNAAAEGLNSKIQTIKKMAYGYRNKEHFKTAIFFHCGGLQLYPATHGNPGPSYPIAKNQRVSTGSIRSPS